MVEIAVLILLLLTVLLAGGVWIAISLMACGWVGMQFVGGNIPAGSVLATTIWGNSASWTLAALPLFIWMGEILFRTRLSEEMFRGLAILFVAFVDELVHVAQGGEPRYEKPPPASAEEVVERAIQSGV